MIELVICRKRHAPPPEEITMGVSSKVEYLRADFLPFFRDPDISFLIVRLTGVSWRSDPAGGVEVEIGALSCQALEVLRSKIARPGMSFRTPAIRVKDPLIRAKNAANQWNNLPLLSGDLLLWAGLATESGEAWTSLAASQIDGAQHPDVEAARRCLEIEERKDHLEKTRALLEEALVAPSSMVRYYALDLLGARLLLGRERGIEILGRALASGKLAGEDQLDLGMSLTSTPFFQTRLGDDPANRQVVSELADHILKVADLTHRKEWALLLASCLLPDFADEPGKSVAARTSLIRSARIDVLALSGGLEKVIPVSAPDERRIVYDLIKALRTVREI
jgi:hypothetical protein